MSLLAALSSMSTLVSGIGPAFSSIGVIATEMWTKLKAWVDEKFIQPIKDKLDEMKEWWTGFKEDVSAAWQGMWDYINENIFTPIGDAITAIGDGLGAAGTFLMDSLGAAWDWINEHVFTPIGDAISAIGDTLGGIGTFLMDSLGAAWDWIDEHVFTPIGNAITAVGDVFSSIGTSIMSVFTGIGGALSNIGSFLMDSFSAAWTWVDEHIFTPMGNAISAIGDALGGIGTALIDGLKWAINGVIGLINTLFSSINFSVDMPEFLGGGSIGIDLSSWQIPLLAKGGIVNKPTLAMIGEDGPEAIIPLSQRNNPSGAGMGGGTYNITVNAGGITDRTDKRALAREIGNMIQQELARSVGGTTMRGRY